MLTAVATSRTSSFIEDSGAAPGPPPKEALTEGFQSAFLAGAGFAILGLIVCLITIRSADSRSTIGNPNAAIVAA